MLAKPHKAKSKKEIMSKVIGGAILASLFVLPAQASTSSISNGTFEADAIGSTTITGWQIINSRINLGVTSIGGCLTEDTSNYLQLRDWESEYEDQYGESDLRVNPDPRVNADNLFLTDDVWDDVPEFDTEIADGGSLGDILNDDDEVIGTFNVEGKVAKLSSVMDSDGGRYGYVVHGPAIVSSEFRGKTIDDLTFRWAADTNGDDYKVFGYLLNTSTCEQTEVLDSTGEYSGWQEVSVAIPTNGTYRFVFISGTFDQSFGGYAGSTMYIDDALITVNELRAEEEEARASQTPPAAKIPNINEFEAGEVLATPGNVLTLSGSRLHCTTYVNINSQAVSFSYSVLPQGLGQLSIAIPVGLKPGPQVMSIDSCGGPVTYLSKLIVAKPPIMLEGRFSTGMEQGLKAREIISWAKANRADYNSVKCISNTKVESQERARQFANHICKQILGVLASPKSTEVEIRDKATHISVWFRIFLSNT